MLQNLDFLLLVTHGVLQDAFIRMMTRSVCFGKHALAAVGRINERRGGGRERWDPRGPVRSHRFQMRDNEDLSCRIGSGNGEMPAGSRDIKREN